MFKYIRHCWFFFEIILTRVEYDAYRTDLEELNLGPRDANTMPRIELSQQQFQIDPPGEVRENEKRRLGQAEVSRREQGQIVVATCVHSLYRLFHHVLC